MESGTWIWGLGLAEANYYIEWIKNKALLFSIGNYSQYPMEMKMEKKKEKQFSGLENGMGGILGLSLLPPVSSALALVQLFIKWN